MPCHFFPQVLHLSIAFQRCWKAHGFQQNLRQVDTCHLFTFYCSSAGKKHVRGEILQLCCTQIPVLSHSIIWLFTHHLVNQPCRVSDTSWRVLQVCGTLHSTAGLGQDSLCSAMRCPVRGESQCNLMMVSRLLFKAGTTSWEEWHTNNLTTALVWSKLLHAFMG